MKTVQKFKADDGVLFDSEKACKAHEKLVEDRDKLIRSILPKKYDTTAFANGDGYIQLKAGTKEDFINGYLALVKRIHPKLSAEAAANPQGLIGRYLNDGDSPLYALWCLACQIDIHNRLWGQPYYANNPGAGEPKLLTTR